MLVGFLIKSLSGFSLPTGLCSYKSVVEFIWFILEFQFTIVSHFLMQGLN